LCDVWEARRDVEVEVESKLRMSLRRHSRRFLWVKLGSVTLVRGVGGQCSTTNTIYIHIYGTGS
jgi:hypothetical protein